MRFPGCPSAFLECLGFTEPFPILLTDLREGTESEITWWFPASQVALVVKNPPANAGNVKR